MQPSTRQELVTYCKRQLGAPVLEINVADEQIDDILDDSIQYFQERHFDGTIQMFMKYKVTETDIKRGRAREGRTCLLYTSPSPRDRQKSRMPSSA